MLKHLIFFFLGILITGSFMGCEGCNEIQTDPKVDTPEEKVTENGFKYIQHIQNEGPKPQFGQYAYYNLEIYGIPESEIPLFFEAGNDFRKLVDPKTTQGFESKNPIVDILPLLSVGDSVTIYHSPDSIINLAPEYGGLKMFEYKVTLTAIKTPAEHTQVQIDKFNKRKEMLKETQVNLDGLNAACKAVLADYKAGKLNKIIETKSGLKYFIHEEGHGNILRNGNVVNFFYAGLLMDGTIFENTFETSLGTSIQVGRKNSLPGWDELMSYLKYGAKVSVFVPYELAYGEAGNPPTIPPKAEVMYYMELVE